MDAENFDISKNRKMGKRIATFRDSFFENRAKKFTSIYVAILIVTEIVLLYGGLVTYGNEDDLSIMIIPIIFGLGVLIFYMDLPWKRNIVLYEEGIEFWTQHRFTFLNYFQPFSVFFHKIEYINQKENGRLSIGGIYLHSPEYETLILSTFRRFKQRHQ